MSFDNNMRQANMAGGMNMGGFQNMQNMSGSQMQSEAVNFWHNRVKVVDPIDTQVWDLVRNVPYIKNKAIAIVITILNVIFAGVGTLISACAGDAIVSKT